MADIYPSYGEFLPTSLGGYGGAPATERSNDKIAMKPEPEPCELAHAISITGRGRISASVLPLFLDSSAMWAGGGLGARSLGRDVERGVGQAGALE
jgi:hypothetical protein